ncbi:hypothetical protein [Actinoplanes sp. HUAS TT8]|uniref:hypothetical protein n=1 Tax=Actinoplanes sp. HUAS TT8 TaxID=3447453 RepID=UPI003F51CFE9
MRTNWRILTTGLLVVGLLAVGGIALVRWRAAGRPQAIVPPDGATTSLPEGGAYRVDVETRAGIIALGLRSGRGKATVTTYAMDLNSSWIQTRDLIAGQLGRWERLGDCADDPRARMVECTWREPTRWWPREVRIAVMRPPAAGQDRDGWPDRTVLLIGSGRGA